MSPKVVAFGAVVLLAAMLAYDLALGPPSADAQTPALEVAVTDGADCGDLDVAWNEIDGATAYKVSWVSTGARYNTDDMHTTSDGTVTEGTLIFLERGVRVTVTVEVLGGPSAGETDSDSGTAGDTGCQAPVVRVTSGPSCGDLSLRWDPIHGVGSYSLRWTATPGGTGSATLDDTSYTITGLPSGASVMLELEVIGGPSDQLKATGLSGTAGCGFSRPFLPPVQLQPPVSTPDPDPVEDEDEAPDPGFAPDPSNPDPSNPTAPVPPAQVQLRDNLIVAQEALLNRYRCMFDADVSAVPGGCVDGEPASGPTRPGEAPANPTQADITLRDELVVAQEALLNRYRCMFDIDVDAVPGGCVNGAPAPVGRPVAGAVASGIDIH